MQQLECESNSITCMSCLYVHVYGNKVVYLSIYLSNHHRTVVISHGKKLLCEVEELWQATSRSRV